MARSAGIRPTACTTIPSVDVPASSQIIGGVHRSAGSWATNERRKIAIPRIWMTFARAGVHIVTPKRPRTLSTCDQTA